MAGRHFLAVTRVERALSLHRRQVCVPVPGRHNHAEFPERQKVPLLWSYRQSRQPAWRRTGLSARVPKRGPSTPA
jgi:hypothetical protein